MVKQENKNSLKLKFLHCKKNVKKLIDIFTKYWPLENSHLNVLSSKFIWLKVVSINRPSLKSEAHRIYIVQGLVKA
jgi:hypothetical protein